MSASQRRGRPRSEGARRAVLDAARAIFAREGYASATIDAVAAKSGVAKTTIYRWWPNRAALMIELLTELGTATAPPPGDGDPLKALRSELRLVARASEALPGRLLMALLADAEHDAELHEKLVHAIFTPRRRATAAAFRRGQELGIFRREIPPLLAVDLLFGPLFYRKYVRHEALTPHFVSQLSRHVLDGMRTRRSGGS